MGQLDHDYERCISNKLKMNETCIIHTDRCVSSRIIFHPTVQFKPSDGDRHIILMEPSHSTEVQTPS